MIQSTTTPALGQIGSEANAHSGSARDLLERSTRIIALRRASLNAKNLIKPMISALIQHRHTIELFRAYVGQKGLELTITFSKRGKKKWSLSRKVADMESLELGAACLCRRLEQFFEGNCSLEIERPLADNLTMVMSGLLRRSCRIRNQRSFPNRTQRIALTDKRGSNVSYKIREQFRENSSENNASPTGTNCKALRINEKGLTRLTEFVTISRAYTPYSYQEFPIHPRTRTWLDSGETTVLV
ncbi:MAG: hypothetical protein AAF222_10190 [Pseudomonadota bacterium]